MRHKLERTMNALMFGWFSSHKPPYTASLIGANGVKVNFYVPADCAIGIGQREEVEKLTFPVDVCVTDRDGLSMSVQVLQSDSY